MKLLALQCPHCASSLTPDEHDVVIACPNCKSAVLLEEGGLRLVDDHVAAPSHKNPQAWLPFWGFDGQVNVQSREAQNNKISLNRWISTYDSQSFWNRASRFFVPAWDIDLPQASELTRSLLESQPTFQRIDRPDTAIFQPAVIRPEDAQKLLELAIVTFEAARRDWLKKLDFSLEMSSPVFWVLPAEQKKGRWQLLAKSTRRYPQ
ncbi:MAG: hypothetical protein R3C44_17870 [Chloroflexota bacterium]